LALLFGSFANLAPQLLAQNAPKPHRKVIMMFEPEYPSVLKNGHFEGQVRLDATVQPNGNVSKIEIKGGNPMLSQYASQAVMRWKYAPAPAQTVEEVTFNFNPNNR
jgi:TonB family protein